MDRHLFPGLALRVVSCLVLLVLLVLLVVVSRVASGQPFTEVTADAGFAEPGLSYSASFGDFDGDGWIDLFVANGIGGRRDYVYRNLGNGRFIVVDDSTTRRLTTNTSSGRWMDYDGDGKLDLLVANLSGSAIEARNDGSGRLLISESSSISDARRSRRFAPADYDMDGDIDVFVTQRQDRDNMLFENLGNGVYRKVSDNAITTDGGDSTCAEWADVDNDGDLDLFVCNTRGTNAIYENLGNGSFVKRNISSISVRSDRTGSASWGDLDGDGDMDLYVSNVDELNQHYENRGEWEFVEVRSGPHVQSSSGSQSSTVVDVDNDGYLDIFVGNLAGRNELFMNDGSGRFRAAQGFAILEDERSSTSANWADIDRDGDLDLFITNLGQDDTPSNQLFRNDLDASGAGWLHLALKGLPGNTAAIGARVSALVGGFSHPRWQIRELTGGPGSGTTGDEVVFGLGHAAGVDSLVIRWPSGVVEAVGKVDGNRRLEIPEPRVELLDRVIATGSGARIDVEVIDETRSLRGIAVWYRDAGSMVYASKQAVRFTSGWPTSNYRVEISTGGATEYYLVAEFERFVRKVGTPDQPLTVLTPVGGQPVSPDLGSELVDVYPNPAASAVRVTLELASTGTVEISVWDALGRRVAQEQAHGIAGKQEVSISLGHLPPGLYLVVASRDGRSIGTLSVVRAN